jgi:hypothetical protein
MGVLEHAVRCREGLRLTSRERRKRQVVLQEGAIWLGMGLGTYYHDCWTMA